MKYYLAIDIGASSGRHMLCCVKNSKIEYEEIHRFPNGVVDRNGTLCWDLDALYAEILAGIGRCAEIGKIPISVGIDTWGVDFVLLGESDNLIGDTVAYRDSRTMGMDEEVFKLIPEAELYSRTGVPKMIYNTIYQLMAAKKAGLLNGAKKMLMIPDYLHYRLTGSGIAKTEYTNATTTGLVNAATGQWDKEVIKICGYPAEIFQEIVQPGTTLGGFTSEVQGIVGFDAKVVAPATHDTASAIAAVPAQTSDVLYISSGTWSIIGTEKEKPDTSAVSMAKGFSNGGGYGNRTIYLKNIMGLWMIQSVKKELGDEYSFAELCTLAEAETIASLIDCNHRRFFAPKSMIDEIKNACKESGQTIPHTPGQLAAVIYNSLAACYKTAAKELEDITGVAYPAINIIGGGANATYLNELTEKVTGKKVYAGPTEATAIGNALAQMIAAGEFKDIAEARKRILPL